jgi:DNA-binding LytR/AlgR family response regulator
MLMQKSRQLIIAKSGTQYITIKLNDIAFFTTSDKLVFAVVGDGRKFLVDQKLADLEAELDPGVFFRVNRQYIINAFFIKSFLPYKRGQIILDILVNNFKGEIIVSQLLTPDFKAWIHNI